MKKIITLLAGTLLATSASAIPAMRVWRTCRQADGTVLKVMTVGDEHFNYALTEDGIPVLPCKEATTMPESTAAAWWPRTYWHTQKA